MRIKFLILGLLFFCGKSCFSMSKGEMEDLRNRTRNHIQNQNDDFSKILKQAGSQNQESEENQELLQKAFTAIQTDAEASSKNKTLPSEVNASESLEGFSSMLQKYKNAGQNDCTEQQVLEELKAKKQEMLKDFNMKTVEGNGVREKKASSIKELARLAVVSQFKLPSDFASAKAKEFVSKKDMSEAEINEAKHEQANARTRYKNFEADRDRADKELRSNGFFSKIGEAFTGKLKHKINYAEQEMRRETAIINKPIPDNRPNLRIEETKSEKEADEMLKKMKVFEGKLIRWNGSFQIGNSEREIWSNKPYEVRNNPKACHYVGYNGNDNAFLKLGNEDASEHWCCFENTLARIIHTDPNGGRARFRPLGKGSKADCTGLSLAEVERIDFDKIDFSEFEEELVQKAGGRNPEEWKAVSAEKIQKSLGDDSNSVYNKMTDKNSVDSLTQQAIRERNKTHNKSWLETAVDWFTGSY